MVYFNRQATADIDTIVHGLLTWEKHQLELSHVMQYRNDIVTFCKNLEHQSYHHNCIYTTHKQYGSKFMRYQRNAKTTWYIIYNIDPHKNIYIERIISNYQNASER